jgi:hypothetical protein
MDRRSSCPSGSFRAVDLKDPPLTTQLIGNASWSDTWPLCVPHQVLTIEIGSLDEGVRGKQSRSPDIPYFGGTQPRVYEV